VAYPLRRRRTRQGLAPRPRSRPRVNRVRSIAAALAVWALLLAPAAVAASPGTAALQVALWARGLYRSDIDGVRGPLTDGAVRRFQARNRLVVDGIVGPQTRRRLGWRGRPRLGRRVLRAGRRGWDVAALQFALARHGFPSGPMDGIFGPRTDAAMRRFQAWAGLFVDGLAGPATVAALRRGLPSTPLRFLAPIGAPVGDGFGARGNAFHSGVDYVAGWGVPVAAAGFGCVETVTWDSGYGNLVVIAHRFDVTSWYAHLNTVAVRRGECVRAGARVGSVGSTGRSTGPHLHFEIRVRGAAIDPLRVTSAPRA
jgi:peptidoglycan hydrolase-like protein with peptidoglycan-binding domain